MQKITQRRRSTRQQDTHLRSLLFFLFFLGSGRCRRRPAAFPRLPPPLAGARDLPRLSLRGGGPLLLLPLPCLRSLLADAAQRAVSFRVASANVWGQRGVGGWGGGVVLVAVPLPGSSGTCMGVISFSRRTRTRRQAGIVRQEMNCTTCPSPPHRDKAKKQFSIMASSCANGVQYDTEHEHHRCMHRPGGLVVPAHGTR